MNLLEVCNLRKTFGNLVAVEDVSFSVAPGEVFGLLGPNGAGKSTTMNMIVGLLAPDSGAIRLDGRELVSSKTATSDRRSGWCRRISPSTPI